MVIDKRAEEKWVGLQSGSEPLRGDGYARQMWLYRVTDRRDRCGGVLYPPSPSTVILTDFLDAWSDPKQLQKPTKIHFDPNQLETTSLSFLNLKKQIQNCLNHFDRKLRAKLYRGQSMLYNSGSTSRKSEKALRSVITKLCGVKNQFCLPNYASDSAKVSLIRDFQAVLQLFSNLVRSEVRFGCENGSRRLRRSGKYSKRSEIHQIQKVSETKKAILAQFYYSFQIGFKPVIIRDRDLPKLWRSPKCHKMQWKPPKSTICKQ